MLDDGTVLPPASAGQRRALLQFLARPILLRTAGVCAALFLLLVIQGCLCLSIGNRELERLEDGSFAQEGSVKLRPGCILDVYYPIPFASPPCLTIEGGRLEYDLLEQHADHFRIRSHPAGDCVFLRPPEFSWRARGVRATLVPVPAPPLPTQAPSAIGPPQLLPPAPVPVTKTP